MNNNTYTLLGVSIALLGITVIIIAILKWRGRKPSLIVPKSIEIPQDIDFPLCKTISYAELKKLKDIKDIHILSKDLNIIELNEEQKDWVEKLKSTEIQESDMRKIYFDYDNDIHLFIYLVNERIQSYGLLVICENGIKNALTIEEVRKMKWPEINSNIRFFSLSAQRFSYTGSELSWKYDKQKDAEIFKNHIYIKYVQGQKTTLKTFKEYVHKSTGMTPNVPLDNLGLLNNNIIEGFVSTISYNGDQINLTYIFDVKNNMSKSTEIDTVLPEHHGL